MHYPRRQLLRLVSLGFGSTFVLGRSARGAAQTAGQSSSAEPLKTTGKNGVVKAAGMEKVTGIGGLFFRAHDPESLGRWYEQYLGVTLTTHGLPATGLGTGSGPDRLQSFSGEQWVLRRSPQGLDREFPRA